MIKIFRMIVALQFILTLVPVNVNAGEPLCHVLVCCKGCNDGVSFLINGEWNSNHDYINIDVTRDIMQNIKDVGINTIIVDLTNPSQWEYLFNDYTLPTMQIIQQVCREKDMQYLIHMGGQLNPEVRTECGIPDSISATEYWNEKAQYIYENWASDTIYREYGYGDNRPMLLIFLPGDAYWPVDDAAPASEKTYLTLFYRGTMQLNSPIGTRYETDGWGYRKTNYNTSQTVRYTSPQGGIDPPSWYKLSPEAFRSEVQWVRDASHYSLYGSYDDTCDGILWGIADTKNSVSTVDGVVYYNRYPNDDPYVYYDILKEELNPETVTTAPANLFASTGNQPIELDWANNTETQFTGTYKVYRSEQSGDAYSLIAETTTSKFIDYSVVVGMTYYYVVTAIDSINGETGYSNEVKGTTDYEQDFTTGVWDQYIFNSQWEQLNSFDSTDIYSGYLHLNWTERRAIISKQKIVSPYDLETVIQAIPSDATYCAAAVVVRANVDDNLENVQEPILGGVFNRTGVAFFPKEGDYDNIMIVQFTNADYTAQDRIEVSKPAGLNSFTDKYNFKIEDRGDTINVYINDSLFVKIEFGGLSAGTYTSGTVYDANNNVRGTFSNMKVDATGKVALALRGAQLNVDQIRVTPLIPFGIFENFENGYDNLIVTGTAFGSAPIDGTYGAQTITGYLGGGVASSYANPLGDNATGTLISYPFIINTNKMGFLIGGGDQPSTLHIDLIIDGTVVKTATGHDSDSLRSEVWDVSAYVNQTATIQIVDNYSGGWGHIIIDHIEGFDETVPDAPTKVRATASDTEAFITFTPPEYDEDSPITFYTVTSSPGGITGSAATSPVTVNGLTNGTEYTFTVTATNSIGKSVAGEASNAVIPNIITLTSSGVIEDFENGYNDWIVTGTAFGTAPIDGAYGAQNINGYLGNGVASSYANPSGDNATGILTSQAFRITNDSIRFLIGGGNLPFSLHIDLVIDGTAVKTATGHDSDTLRTEVWDVSTYDGQIATIQIVDNAAVGWGHIDIDHFEGFTVPDAPTNVAATAGNTLANITFTPPMYDGGSIITSYTVTSSPGAIAQSASASPITITGLTNDTEYTFTVTATNAIGEGVASKASNSVIPFSYACACNPPQTTTYGMWDFVSNTEGYQNSNNVSSSVSNGIMMVTITGDDPHMWTSNNLSIDATANKLVKIRMKNNTAATTSEFFYLSSNGLRLKSFSINANDTNFTEYIVDMNDELDWAGIITQTRFDPVAGVSSGIVEVDYIMVAPKGLHTWSCDCELLDWTVFQHINRSVANNSADLTITGDDPVLLSPNNLTIDADSDTQIEIRMKNNTANTQGMIIFYKGTSSIAGYIQFPINENSDYTIYTIDMGNVSGWSGRVTQIRFDPVDNNLTGSVKLDYIKIVPVNYLKSSGQIISNDRQSIIKTGINIYPNPVSHSLFIETTEASKVEMYTIAGQKVYSNNILSQPHIIDVSHWKCGIYFVKIKCGNKVYNRKLIIR